MKAIGKTESLWDAQQVKKFAEQTINDYGNGWRMLSVEAKDKAILATVALVIISQPDDVKIKCGEAHLLRRDIHRTIGTNYLDQE